MQADTLVSISTAIPAFDAFITNIGLAHYLPTLRAAGVQSISQLAALTDEGLQAAGVLTRLSRGKLLSALHEESLRNEACR